MFIDNLSNFATNNYLRKFPPYLITSKMGDLNITNLCSFTWMNIMQENYYIQDLENSAIVEKSLKTLEIIKKVQLYIGSLYIVSIVKNH